MTELVYPIIHINGSAADTLLELRSETIAAIEDAGRALAAMAPNARDYYVSADTELYVRAVDQHRRRMEILQGLIRELRAEIDHLEEAEAARP